MSDGSTSSVAVTWSATGGTVTSAGAYTAGDIAGAFRVIARHQGGTLADTVVVNVAEPAPTLQSISLTPVSVTLGTGATQQFTAVGRMSDNSTTSVDVTYSATGGSVSASGLYTAGNTAGTFRVIAVQEGGALADTSVITVSPPAPTLTAIELTPASVTVEGGETQQFSAVGRLSDNSTTSVAVTWSETGRDDHGRGASTPAGEHGGDVSGDRGAAGGDAGGHERGDDPGAALTLTRIEVSPATATVAAGETQQFSAVGRLSDNTTTSVAVTWSETGGTITTGGLYTAGSTAGTYRVIAVEQGGPGRIRVP